MPYHVVVKQNATIPDTLDLINKAVNVYWRSPFVSKLVQQLNPSGSKYDFCKRLFDWVCSNVKYQLDNDGHEEVWSPEKTAREGRGDCKKMTTLIACVLKNAGIECVLKHVRYKGEQHTHIYVIVPFPTIDKYLTVDPVNHCQWNTEVDHASATLHFLDGRKMDLHMMGKVPAKKTVYTFKSAALYTPIRGVDDDLSELAGVGCRCSGVKEEVLATSLAGDFNITGLDDDEIIYGVVGRRKKRSKAEKREKRKERRQKLFHTFKAVNLAVPRASFLTLVRSNIFRLANRMAKVWIHDPTALTEMWKKFGGDPKVLKNTIKKGAWKSISKDIKGIGYGGSPSVMDLEQMYINGVGIENDLETTEGIGVAPAVAAAVIAAATPILLAVIKIIGKSKHDQDTSPQPEESNAEIMSEGVQEGAQNYADNAPTEGIGYADEVDEVVSGEDYDYIDGMGRKRKKNKPGRAAKKAKKAQKKAARRAKRGKGKDAEGGGADYSEMTAEEMKEEATDQAKSKARLTDNDIRTLSTLAEYGTRKILKGKVSQDDIKKLPIPQDDGGTEDTPLLKPTKEEKAEANITDTTPTTTTTTTTPSGQAASFGLAQINSFSDLLHWFRGMMCVAFALVVGIGYTHSAMLITNSIAIVSLVYLSRKHILRYHSLLFSKFLNPKQK